MSSSDAFTCEATPSPVDGGALPSTKLENVLSYLILFGGIATIALAIYVVVTTYSGLPAWDGWIQISYAAQRGTQSALSWLWTQHYEHLLPIPKLFLLADLRWFHADQVLLLSSISLIQLLHLAVLGWSMHTLGGWRGYLWRTGFGICAFCLFCLAQWENLTWGFQTCFVLPGLFASLSFLGLLLYWKNFARVESQPEWKYIALSIAAALGATYSLSNGNLVWPLLIAAALLLRLNKGAVLAYVIAAAASTGAYAARYSRAGALPIQSPVTILKYLAAYFGCSWVQASTSNVYHLSQNTVRTAEITGAVGLALALVAALKFPAYVRAGNALGLHLMLIMLFCLGTGVVTAIGRSYLGVGQAFASRYQTVALLFWCCLALLWLVRTTWEFPKRSASSLLWPQMAALFVFACAAYLSGTTIKEAKIRGFQHRAAAAALISGVPDLPQLLWSNYHPEQVLSLEDFLRTERLSVFSEPDASWIGKSLDSVFHLLPASACAGKFESVKAITGTSGRSLRIDGWAWDATGSKPAKQIVVTKDNTVTGIGAVGDWRSTSTASTSGNSSFAGYTGYAPDLKRSDVLKVYAIIPGTPQASACYLGTLNDPNVTD